MAAAVAPLQALAQKHAGGAAAYARVVAEDLLEAFLATEERFSSGATDQEVIDYLRQVRCGAHPHAPRLPAPACTRMFFSPSLFNISFHMIWIVILRLQNSQLFRNFCMACDSRCAE